jgi:hypothetical protein
MTIEFNNEIWPDSGRTVPPNATLGVRTPYNSDKYTSKWRDMCWYDPKRDVWIYISTLPA